MGDFNINLLHADVDKETTNFMDNIESNSFFPAINLPSCITASSKTLIDNIFYNDICKKVKAGNIATTRSNHPTQFLAIPKETPILSTHNTTKPSFKDFDLTKLKNELSKINWKNKIQKIEKIIKKITHFIFKIFS